MSALFCDLVGFTSRAEVMDPEDVHEMLRIYYASVRSEFEGFGGTVAKFIGDAVFVLFGAPRAHEDDPERAVRAALAGVDAVGEAQRRPSRARPARPHRRDDRRGAHHFRSAARRERRAGLGRHPQHGRAAGGRGAAGHHPRRRRDLPGDASRHRVRAGRAHQCEGQGRARARMAADRSACTQWASASERPHASRWSAVARSWRSAARHPRRRPQQSRAAARDDRRRARDRQEPPRLRALPPHRRDGGPHQLPPRPLAALPRGRLLLGARRDRQGPGRHARDRRRRRPPRASCMPRCATSSRSRPRRAASKATCARSSASATPSTPASTSAGRPSPRGGTSSRRSRGGARSCSSSRTSTGPTTGCSTSSSTSSGGPGTCRS